MRHICDRFGKGVLFEEGLSSFNGNFRSQAVRQVPVMNFGSLLTFVSHYTICLKLFVSITNLHVTLDNAFI
ncbi:hypothetical protein SLE2022_141880 [Rubroshorea leprosula]